MNRMEQYRDLMVQLDREPPGLETTLERAIKKRRRAASRWVLRPLAGLAVCFAAFVLLVNFCVPVAYACSRVPGLRELAEAVTFSRSLSDAVENEYVQPISLTESRDGITASVEYLIVDQKQINIFFRLESDIYAQLEADSAISSPDGEALSYSIWTSGMSPSNGELRSVTVDFVDDTVPERLLLELRVYPSLGTATEAWEPEGSTAGIEPSRQITQMEFLLEFDPKFTATGTVIPVNQTVELEGQKITITDIEVYPTHLRVDIAESESNTAWLRDLEFYIETDWGMRFEAASSGITATGSENSRSMVSYRADSTYFYQAEHLKLVITGAQWLKKDMQTTYLNLVTGETGPLPEGAEFVSAERRGSDWVVTFKAEWDDDRPMFQLFDNNFYDREGNEYHINSWSLIYGDPDEEGNFTYFYDEIPLRDYPYDEVWLSPVFSHEWTAEEQILVIIR